jgi:hypothetical protein
MIETSHLTVTEGDPRMGPGRRDWSAARCPDCGSQLWGHHPQLGPGIAFVGSGMLDEGERLAPEAHYFTRSKHPWVTLPAEVAAFETLGDPGKAGARERIGAVLAALGDGKTLEGYTGERGTAR